MKITARVFARCVPALLGSVVSLSACQDNTEPAAATGGAPVTASGGSTSGGSAKGGASTSGGSLATGGSMGGSVTGGASSGGSLGLGGGAGSAGASNGGSAGAAGGGAAGSTSGSGGGSGASGSGGIGGGASGAAGTPSGGYAGGGTSGAAGSGGVAAAGGAAGGGAAGAAGGGGVAGGAGGGAAGACGTLGKSGDGSYTRTGWTATYACTGTCPAKNQADTGDVETNAFDGNYQTRWSTGVYQSALAQQNRFPLFFTVDMKQATTVSKLSTHPGCKDNKDSPGTVEVEVSTDGTNFTTVTPTPHTPANVGSEACPPTASSVATDTITFPSTCARYIRLKATRRTSPDVYWAIGEMYVFP